MSELPPLCNFFAVFMRSPQQREVLVRDMRGTQDFRQVWEPVRGWVVGARPVPSSATLSTGRFAPIVCAEGLANLQALERDEYGSLERVAALSHESPEHLDRIPGDFTFVHLESTGRATAVRSCSGRVPVYMVAEREYCAIGTRLDYIVRYLPKEHNLDPLANGVWVTGYRLTVDERSLLSGVRLLRAGHFARVSVDGVSKSHRYWDPRPTRPPVWNPRMALERAERLRGLLVEMLDRELPMSGDSAVLMSGGVDSTALTYLAARTLGRRVSTVTFVPKHKEDLRHELSYIEPVRRDLPLRRSIDLVFDRATYLALARLAPDTVFQVREQFNSIQLLNNWLGSSASVLLAGLFADEVTGSRRMLPDWLATTSFRTLMTLGRNVPVGRRIPLLWGMHRVRRFVRRPREPWTPRLANFVRREVDQEYREWCRAQRHALATEDRPLPMLFHSLQFNGWQLDLWEGTTSQDTRPFTPFYSRRALELAFQAHPLEQFDAQTKKLLRHALRNDVPARNLSRQDKGIWRPPTAEDEVPWLDEWPSEVSTFLTPFAARRKAFYSFDAASLVTLIKAVMTLRKRRAERQQSACISGRVNGDSRQHE